MTTGGRLLFFCALMALGVMGCGSSLTDQSNSTDIVEPAEEPAGESRTPEDTEAAEAVGEPVLETACFTLGPDFDLPANHLAANVAPDDKQCWFVTQAEGQADTTVIAGELWKSSGGNSFEDFVAIVEEGLAVGQEPDLLPLQLLNSGATGNELTVFERTEIAGPNRAVVFFHESDRRDGFRAYSAVVDLQAGKGGATTALFMWGLDNEVNRTLFFDIINEMEIDETFVLE